MILLQHDGELRDVRALLDRVGIPVRERIGSLRPAESRAAWHTVIATPRRLLEFKVSATGRRPTLVAIADRVSNTLKSQMQRLRIDFVVNRPVHPMALRLLLLHAVYAGPERRKRDRISIGAEIRARTGLFSKPAMLAEISQRGARIITPQPLAKGSTIRLSIGRELTRGANLRLSALVVRTTRADDGATEAGLKFEELGAKATERLRRFVDLHKRGPVQVRHHTLHDVAVTPVADRPTPEPVAPVRRTPVDGPASRSTLDRSAGAAEPAEACEVDEAERRRGDRLDYESRVVALVDEAARVFLGRDISTGGMRVDAHPEIGLGSKLKLALHAGPRSEPVLVQAVVDRDDGAGGVFLRFLDVSSDVERELDLIMRRLNVSSCDDDATDLVVSEVIEVEAPTAQ